MFVNRRGFVSMVHRWGRVTVIRSGLAPPSRELEEFTTELKLALTTLLIPRLSHTGSGVESW